MVIKLKKYKLNLFARILVLILVFGVVFSLAASIEPVSNSRADNVQRVDILGYVNYSGTQSFPNKKNVLFFNANWCSTCTVADLNFRSEIKSIPSYLTIYKVDFATAISLKQKYSVTLQHTFVQVDAMGNELKKWVGSYTVDDVLKELV